MDRDALARFLSGETKTFRWNDGESFEDYDAVEASPAGLRYYHWSHRAEDGGPSDEATQSLEAFEADGPLREMPEKALAGLREHVARLASGRGKG